MARSAIPDFGIEYPEYEYRPFPRYIGLDAEGEPLIAKTEDEVAGLTELAVFPKLMGKDKNGKDVIAQIPRDLDWKKSQVVTPAEDPAVVKAREEDRIAAEAETSRKAKAYDDLMAAGGANAVNATKDQASTGTSQNALTGGKKAKAA